jgi:NAD(P)-dependent dehydrogenase (short-subunit alcohol dehydrogenase family)
VDVMIKDKVAVVTGAGSGIGRAVACFLAKHGAHLLLIGRTRSKLERVQKEIQENHDVDVMIAIADVSDFADLKKAVDAGKSRFGCLNILSHNAAIFPRSTLEQLTPEEWSEVIHINLSGALFALQAVRPHMVAQKSGSIVFTSSVAGTVFGVPTLSSYAASKAGVDGLMKSAALELSPYNIRVNSVCPGSTLTFEVDTPEKEKIVTDVSKVNPLQRWATPQEIAQAIFFLASDLSSYITGQCLVVDGGLSVLAEPRHISAEFLSNSGVRPASS